MLPCQGTQDIPARQQSCTGALLTLFLLQAIVKRTGLLAPSACTKNQGQTAKPFISGVYPCCLAWGFLVTVCLATLTACAPKPHPTPPGISPWATFVRHQKALEPLQHFVLKTSINYTSAQHTHRVIMRLFGNLDYPIRMDLTAGMGQTLSMWREDTSLWQAYFPQEKRLYTAQDPRHGVQVLGFPSPFDLRELALVLQGNLMPLLPDQPVHTLCEEAETTIFFDQSGRVAWLRLDSLGRALELQGTQGWRVVFDHQETSPYSHKISMIMDATTRAIIRVKSLAPAVSALDLALGLPDDTETINLDAVTTMTAQPAHKAQDRPAAKPDKDTNQSTHNTQ